MANTAQARKRAKQSEKARQHNMAQKSSLRTAIKKVLKAVQTGDKTLAETAYKSAVSLADRAINKKLIHGNKASRIKSRLNQKIKALA